MGIHTYSDDGRPNCNGVNEAVICEPVWRVLSVVFRLRRRIAAVSAAVVYNYNYCIRMLSTETYYYNARTSDAY